MLRIMTSRWRAIDQPIYPWVPTVDRVMACESLADMRGPLIHVFSDYGGEHRQSEYATSALLYMDVMESMPWEIERRRVRSQYLNDGRRLSFKGLNDGMKRRALVPFLEASDQISGVCVVFAIHKSIFSNVWRTRHFRDMWSGMHKLQHAWNSSGFERMLGVAHHVGLLVGGLSIESQDVYWFSDEDQIFANANVTEDLRKVLGFFTGHYVRHPLGQVGLGTSAIDVGDRYEEDHVALTDLAAGGMAEMLTRLREFAGRIPVSVAMEYPGRFNEKTEIISAWFGDSSRRLKKILILFEPDTSSTFSVSRLIF